MQHHLRTIPTFTLALALLLGACNREPQPQEETETATSSWQFVDLADDHPVMTTGQQVAGELIGTLLGRVTEEMQAKGPIGAIEVCRTEAMQLTGSVAAKHEHVLAIKRTSDRIRNPLNKPDEAEQLALDRFRDMLADPDKAPGPVVQLRKNEEGSTEHRFYQPMFLAAACLQCHGQKEDIQPAVLAALEQQYPEDQATGYIEGAWRGLIRVSVQTPP